MDTQQIPLPVIDQITPQQIGEKYTRRKVERTLTKMRQLHEELNNLLYARPTERPTINSPKDAYDILRPFLEHL